MATARSDRTRPSCSGAPAMAVHPLVESSRLSIARRRQLHRRLRSLTAVPTIVASWRFSKSHRRTSLPGQGWWVLSILPRRVPIDRARVYVSSNSIGGHQNVCSTGLKSRFVVILWPNSFLPNTLFTFSEHLVGSVVVLDVDALEAWIQLAFVSIIMSIYGISSMIWV